MPFSNLVSLISSFKRIEPTEKKKRGQAALPNCDRLSRFDHLNEIRLTTDSQEGRLAHALRLIADSVEQQRECRQTLPAVLRAEAEEDDFAFADGEFH